MFSAEVISFLPSELDFAGALCGSVAGSLHPSTAHILVQVGCSAPRLPLPAQCQRPLLPPPHVITTAVSADMSPCPSRQVIPARTTVLQSNPQSSQQRPTLTFSKPGFSPDAGRLRVDLSCRRGPREGNMNERSNKNHSSFFSLSWRLKTEPAGSGNGNGGLSDVAPKTWDLLTDLSPKRAPSWAHMCVWLFKSPPAQCSILGKFPVG